MRLLVPLTCIGALALSSCADHEIPPPPAHPAIEGDWESVSFADIRAAIAVVKQDFARMGRPDFAIYRVNVADHNHIEVYYHPPVLKEEGQLVERVKGKWQLGEERIISTWEPLRTSMLSPSGLTNRSSQPLAAEMLRFTLLKTHSLQATLALASGGSASSR